jgi:regulator of sigma E protease
MQSLILNTDLFVLGAAQVIDLAAWGATLWNIVQVALGLGFVIFVHELGHFLAAKYFGVKCEKFYVGFDVPIRLGPIRLPAKLFHFQWGETEYGIGSIPLGGYVKMLGQDDDPRNAERENERIKLEGGVAENGQTGLDPRSFPAKSVFARMVIISAGVIMNIIFGILFAAVAFNIGVKYQPTVLGAVSPGDPAWREGLQSGDRIVRIAEMDKDNEKLAYRDMTESILLAGLDTPEDPIPVKLLRDGTEIEKSIVGTKRHDPDGYIIQMGVVSAGTTRIDDKKIIRQNIKEGWKDVDQYIPDLKEGDVIVAINGNPLKKEESYPHPLEYQLNRYLHPLHDQTVELTVERPSVEQSAGKPSTVKVTWKPMPMRTLGLRLAPGEVTSIQKGSPAETAKVQIGDRLVGFAGKEIVDAIGLQSEVAKQAGKLVELELARGTEEKIRFEWKVPDNFVVHDSGLQYAPFGLELPGSGLVYSVSNIIGKLESELPLATNDAKASGTDAAASPEQEKLAAGQEIVQIRIDIDDEGPQREAIQKLLKKETLNQLLQGRDLRGGYSGHYLHSLIQILPLGTRVQLFVKKPGDSASKNQVQRFTLQTRLSNELYSFERGLITEPLTLRNTSDNFGAAIAMGIGEIQKRALGVVRFVRMAFSWKVPQKAAGGPAMIFYAATSAASEGFTDLLMFLTMLSANLAVINFLPIPALDGGHMMFLVAEAIRGKPVNEQLQMRLTMAGVLALLGLMLFVCVNDYFNLSRILG